MAEIKKLLEENDVAAFVVLHTPGFAEYMNHVRTSYSCATIERNGIHFRLKEEEVGKEKAKEIASNTFNMVNSISRLVAMHSVMYIEADKFLADRWNGIAFLGEITGNEEQNN